MTLDYTDQNALDSIARDFLKLIGERKVVCFEGEMGMGKTTFIQAICKVLNVIDQVQSPTYAIVNEYHTSDNDTIHHMDLYRLKDLDEALNAGLEEILYSGSLCLIEWPGLIKEILPDDAVFTQLEMDGLRRKLTIFNI